MRRTGSPLPTSRTEIFVPSGALMHVREDWVTTTPSPREYAWNVLEESHLLRLTGQFIAEPGIRDRDERFGALTERPSPHLGHAELRDDLVDRVLGGRDNRPRAQRRLDLRHLP